MLLDILSPRDLVSDNFSTEHSQHLFCGFFVERQFLYSKDVALEIVHILQNNDLVRDIPASITLGLDAEGALNLLATRSNLRSVL